MKNFVSHNEAWVALQQEEINKDSVFTIHGVKHSFCQKSTSQIVLDLQSIQRELADQNLWKTYHKVSEAIKEVGFELADDLKQCLEMVELHDETT